MSVKAGPAGFHAGTGGRVGAAEDAVLDVLMGFWFAGK
jgi:hypothetical protein